MIECPRHGLKPSVRAYCAHPYQVVCVACWDDPPPDDLDLGDTIEAALMFLRWHGYNHEAVRSAIVTLKNQHP